MKYHYTPPDLYFAEYASIYECDHPIYNRCTLYSVDEAGLAVIQQRFDGITKSTYWTEIDPWLVDQIYWQKGFDLYFQKHSSKPMNGLYPTVTIRQLMWALRMKPIKREVWETVFDKCPVGV